MPLIFRGIQGNVYWNGMGNRKAERIDKELRLWFCPLYKQKWSKKINTTVVITTKLFNPKKIMSKIGNMKNILKVHWFYVKYT